MSSHRAPLRTGALPVLAALLLVFAGSSESAEITFDQLLDSGTLTYNGAGGPAVGSQIAIDTIQGSNTPQNNNVTLVCIGCELNFQTGNNVSEGPAVWTFNSGGSFTITGTVPGAGIVAPTVLLQGSFATRSTAERSLGRIIFSGSGFDVKAQELVDFYFGANPPADFIFANTEITARDTTTVGADGSFSGLVAEADVVNTAFVPEPSSTSLFLAGLGFLASAVAARRRRR